MSILDFLSGKKKAAEADRLTAYQQYRAELRRICDSDPGKKADYTKLNKLAEAAGISDQQIVADVNNYQARLQLRADYAQRDRIQREITECARKMDAISAEFEKYKRTVQEQLQTLAEMRRQAEYQLRRYSESETKLRDSCDNPQLIAEQKELRQQRAEISKQHAVAIDTEKKTKARLDAAIQARDGWSTSSALLIDANARAERYEKLQTNVANAQREHDFAKQRAIDLRRSEQDLCERIERTRLMMLEP